tara:strand:- start:130 stop:477 length:348 start_codon:yes stop_codon:yes gene_type:complete
MNSIYQRESLETLRNIIIFWAEETCFYNVPVENNSQSIELVSNQIEGLWYSRISDIAKSLNLEDMDKRFNKLITSVSRISFFAVFCLVASKNYCENESSTFKNIARILFRMIKNP